ncbi:uncharacterized protein SCHCODRAFT_02212174 [Schizophyllum commune H4-8]|uniref:uncharacterized protein n=1 Tax=Schizophyllum commune (strain H4-8 / FGSC 9210) TaxID=578458 RepID=UPI002160487A|nr:uncharacterized protein SCHCODRAFT_02212174 [Schizophyllum commune H4-8]KAI5894577.1 hypothetical protein SCHCODRAFT_02212174 [Schizophyllum commune H4-8]
MLSRGKTYIKDNVDSWEPGKLSKVIAEREKSFALASNYTPSVRSLVILEDILAGQDIATLEEKATKPPPPVVVSTKTTTITKTSSGETIETTTTHTEEIPQAPPPPPDDSDADSIAPGQERTSNPPVDIYSDEVPLVLGLKVYTDKSAPAWVEGQVRRLTPSVLSKQELALGGED